MKYKNSQQFVTSELREKSSLNNVLSELEREDEEPLSIKSLSSTFLGIIMAFLVISLPMISIFLGRPLSHENEMNINQLVKKDGS